MTLARIVEMVKKEFRTALRDPRMRILLLAPPVIQLIIFGYAVNLDVKLVRTAWMDGDRSPSSRALLSHFQGSPHFEVTHFPASGQAAEALLDAGEVDVVVSLLPGFARDLARQSYGRIQILLDGSNSNTAAIVGAYVQRVLASFRECASCRPGGARVELVSRVWFNSNLESRDYFVPGVVVNIIGLVTVMLTAMAIVREKEVGTMEQLLVSPLHPLELMLGKIIPFSLVGLLDMGLVTAAALLLFEIPFRGSALFLLLSSLLFLLTTLGAGLLISTISATQQQAVMGSFFFFMPTFMLSGFAFPIQNMPAPVQYLTYLNPMRYFLEIVRGIFLKGVGLGVLWPQTLALLVLGGLTFGLSVFRFQRRLE